MDWLWVSIIFILISLYYIWMGRLGKVGKAFWVIMLLFNSVFLLEDLGVVSF